MKYIPLILNKISVKVKIVLKELLMRIVQTIESQQGNGLSTKFTKIYHSVKDFRNNK
jgi:ribosomal protein S24E